MKSDSTTKQYSKILCVEDDKDTCELITYVFAQEGYEVRAIEQKDCLKILQQENFQAVILNNYHIGLSGAEITRQIRSFNKLIPIIFLSGESRLVEINKVMQAGADAYLVKPDGLEKLLATVTQIIKSRSSIEQ